MVKYLKLFLVLFILPFSFYNLLKAQSQPATIKYGTLNMRALRYYPNATDANNIMEKVFENKRSNDYKRETFAQYNLYQKTSVDVVANKESLDQELKESQKKNNFSYKYLIQPFESWLEHARAPESYPNYLALTTLIFEDYKTIYEDNQKKRIGSLLHASRAEGLFESIGQQNIDYFLDEIFGDIDLYQNENEVMLLEFKSPLGDHAQDIYSYKLVGMKNVDGKSCYEIAFYCENMKQNAFAGYFYISSDGSFSLVEAKFTLNNPSSMNFLQHILITHTYHRVDGKMLPEKKECSVLMGDEIKGCILVERTTTFNHFSFTNPKIANIWENKNDPDYLKKPTTYWSGVRPMQLTPSQEQVGGLVKTATGSRSFGNIQKAILFLLGNHLALGGINGPVEIGPLTQFISYNDMEGLRLKLGGNTTTKLFNQWYLGGYAAIGTKDRRIKYRSDLMYSLHPRSQYIWEYPKKLISFTYVNDLNIPGQDLLTSNRDNIAYSFSHAATNNMSLQKIGLLTFENELSKGLSYKIGGQFKYDRPEGVVKYMQVQNTDTTHINSISTSEIQLSVRFCPGEKFIQARDKRVFIRRGDVELNLNHRIGIKGMLGSDYQYQITEFNGYKKFTLGNHGSLDLHLAAGKIWNQVPFPLLFIPEGNQSYIFENEGYNCMNFYEFTTDNYVSGNVNFMFNWSPFKLLNKKDKIKSSLGARTIYGPLSDNNNPALHPELFVFNEGVNPLGDTPYVEVNVGFSNIFKILRLEYSRRLTYLNSSEESGGHKVFKGSLLVSANFSF